MTARGAQILAWNAENRLSAVSGGAGFVYDGDGRRVKKTEGGQTTVYPSRFYEKNLTTGEATTYYYHGDKLVALQKGSTLEYVHRDHLGGTVATTNTSGAVAATLRYYAFGGTRASSGTLNTDRQFTGQRLDSTGLYFYQAPSLSAGTLRQRSHPLTVTPLFNGRFYDAGLGRFVQPDPIVPESANPQTFNRYSYVGNNPLTYTDADGHCFILCPDSSGQETRRQDGLISIWHGVESIYGGVAAFATAGFIVVGLGAAAATPGVQVIAVVAGGVVAIPAVVASLVIGVDLTEHGVKEIAHGLDILAGKQDVDGVSSEKLDSSTGEERPWGGDADD